MEKRTANNQRKKTEGEKKQRSKAEFKKSCKKETEDLGHLFKMTRELMGISQKDMADALGISRSYLCELEHGDVTIPAFMVKRYCEYAHQTANVYLRTDPQKDYHEVRTESGQKLLNELPFMTEEDAKDLLSFYEALKKRKSRRK